MAVMKLRRLYLASASPRRHALLLTLGLRPIVVPSGADESPRAGETACSLVARLAETKARAALQRAADDAPGVILGADTEVVIDGCVLGKPGHPEEAANMLRRLSGRAHDVLTGVYLVRSDDGRGCGGVERTVVTFRELDEATLRRYVSSGEGLDKAGAYALQGRGAELVTGVEGSWSNVVGLPLERLPDWLANLDLALDDFRQP